MKNKIIFSFLLVSFSGLLIPPGPAYAESPIPDSEPQCLPFYNIIGIEYELEFEEFIKNSNEQGEWKQIRCSYEAPEDAVLPAGTPFSAVFNALYTDTLMKNPNDLCDRSEIASESVALTFFYDNLSAQIWSTDHVAYWKVSRADIEAQAYNQLDVIANFADTCWEEIEKEFEEPEGPWCLAEPGSSYTRKVGKFEIVFGEVQILRLGQTEWTNVYIDDEIQLGDWIKTGSAGGATIQWTHWKGTEFDDDSRVVLFNDSELCVGDFAENFEDKGLLEQYEDQGIINLIYGKLKAFTKFTGGLEKKTGYNRLGYYSGGSMLIQSRGTEFVLSNEPVTYISKIFLKEGILDITQVYTKEKITLTEGQVLEISGGEAQPVTSLIPEEWDSLISEIGGMTTEIPSWVKNNAGWWADDQIGDQDFAQGIQFLISEGIMKIPETKQTETSAGSDEIPSWIKNNAGWWADGQITDDDFVKGIQYLVGQGIIRV